MTYNDTSSIIYDTFYHRATNEKNKATTAAALDAVLSDDQDEAASGIGREASAAVPAAATPMAAVDDSAATPTGVSPVDAKQAEVLKAIDE